MDLVIRPASLADLPYLYDICLRTGYSGENASKLFHDPFMIGQYFAAPYVHYEIDLCSVITDGTNPQGYILGASDTGRFCDWMNTYWLPLIRRQYPADSPVKSKLELFVVELINRDCKSPNFSDRYPSHLHIDLLPTVQGQGLGRKLIDRFTEQLRAKGSPGLHLSVGVRNTKAIAFYKQVGFSTLKRESGAVVMVKQL